MELQIRAVSKTYPNGVQALRSVTLTIPPGMYGLLGPNGAGKSTLMRILATLQDADAGMVRLGDIDVLNQKDDVRKTLGYLPILLEAEPLGAIDGLGGRIWQRVIGRSELAALEREHAVISTKLLGGRTVVHVYSDVAPADGFEPAVPDLEDVYFCTMAGHIGSTRAAAAAGFASAPSERA